MIDFVTWLIIAGAILACLVLVAIGLLTFNLIKTISGDDPEDIACEWWEFGLDPNNKTVTYFTDCGESKVLPEDKPIPSRCPHCKRETIEDKDNDYPAYCMEDQIS